MALSSQASLASRTVIALLCLLLAQMVQAGSLRAAWRPVQPGDEPATVRKLLPGRAGQAFDPERLTVIPAGRHGAWVLLWPEPGSVPAGRDAVLVIVEPSMLQKVSWFPSHAAPVRDAGLFDASHHWRGHGRIGFTLDAGEASASPLLLRLEPGGNVAPPLRFSLLDAAEFERQDARWLAVASACLAIMLAMAVMALLFAAELRDATFFWYAAYVVAYALILAVQYGYVAQPLGWTWVMAHPGAWGRLATAVSVLSATLFVSRFADLRRYAPHQRVLVLGIGAATAVAMGLGSLPLPWLTRLAAYAINPLLVLGGPVILAASVSAWWRGSRYAGFFLLGWTPLLLITVLGSLQVFGLLGGWTWLGEASLVAGAVEALVLSLGLADRALELRHDRDLAQAQADADPLTGVFNRRGLDRRVEALVASAHRWHRPLSVLFLDLDRFKQLNDCQGHAAGDAALVALTRVMRADMRAHDVLGRYGGEEFLALLPGCDGEAARLIAARICADLQARRIPVRVAGDALSASVGVATLGRVEDAATLIARADAAMYAAKRAGGNQVAQAAPADARADGLRKDGTRRT